MHRLWKIYRLCPLCFLPPAIFFGFALGIAISQIQRAFQ